MGAAALARRTYPPVALEALDSRGRDGGGESARKVPRTTRRRRALARGDLARCRTGPHAADAATSSCRVWARLGAHAPGWAEAVASVLHATLLINFRKNAKATFRGEVVQARSLTYSWQLRVVHLYNRWAIEQGASSEAGLKRR